MNFRKKEKKAFDAGIRKRRNLQRWLVVLLCPVLLTLLAAGGEFSQNDNMIRNADNVVSDALYQQSVAVDGNVALITMDQEALEQIGPLPWDRSVMAEVLERLNANPEDRPAVIGVDVLYSGAGENPESDTALAEAVGRYGNVVLASVATFGGAEDENGEWDEQAVVAFERPLEEIEAGAHIGHINAMLDTDGIIRHFIPMVDIGTEIIPSFAEQICYVYSHQQDGENVDASDSEAFEGSNVSEEELEWRKTLFKSSQIISFYGNPTQFESGFSVADVLNGEIPEGYLDGKIIMIGPYAAGMTDDYPTAIQHAQKMFGVEIQANIVTMILNENYKHAVSDVLQLVLMLAVSGLLAWLLMYRRNVIVSVLAAAVTGGGWLILCKLLWKNGYAMHALWVPAAAGVILVIAVAMNYILEAQEKKMVQETFGRYVDSSVINELMKEDSDSLGLGGKLRDIAVLFVDIRGFTSMSEVLTPAQVVEILNQYLTLTTDCVMRNNGTLDKFVGDCTMAIWNAPLPQEDYIFKACRAAMDMVDGSKALSEKLEKEFGRKVAFGVGVHCGPAIVGNIGAPMRMDFTAIGDTVNTASRLESNAPGGTVYISRAVVEALGERAKVTNLGTEIRLKGKSEGFEIFTLDALESYSL